MANTVVIMPNEPMWLQATGIDPVIPYSATNDRWLMDAIWSAGGVLGATALQVSQRGAGANFSVDVAIGSAVVLGGDTPNQGKYLARSNAVTNVVTPSAPGAGTRVHRIIARIRDKQAVGSGTYDWTLELLEDTGGGTPALPVSAISLALVSIAVGQASVLAANITDVRIPAQDYNGLVPSVKVLFSGNLNSSLEAICTFSSAVWNKGADGPMWAAGSPTIITFKTPGIYRLSAQAMWSNNINGTRQLRIQTGSTLTDANVIAISAIPSFSSIDGQPQQCQIEFPFNANDTVCLSVWQNSGSTLSFTNVTFNGVVTLANNPNWFTATYIQPL